MREWSHIVNATLFGKGNLITATVPLSHHFTRNSRIALHSVVYNKEYQQVVIKIIDDGESKDQYTPRIVAIYDPADSPLA
jgi:hypothetical protein